jgi:CHAT domain-containing protein
MRKLASDFGSEPRLGCNANRENLTTVVKDVDVLHFHGHTATHPNIIYQSLVLSDGKTSETSSGVQEFHHTQSSTSPYRPTLGPHKDAFTVRDAFSVELNLSLASIVACSSGVQNYGTGDEPQGLLSALQYAGCATAIGTLWPVRSEDGRAFTLYFFQAVRRQGDNIASPWNLALSFQKAVRRLQGRKKAGLRLDHPYYWAAFVIHGAWYL